MFLHLLEGSLWLCGLVLDIIVQDWGADLYRGADLCALAPRRLRECTQHSLILRTKEFPESLQEKRVIHLSSGKRRTALSHFSKHSQVEAIAQMVLRALRFLFHTSILLSFQHHSLWMLVTWQFRDKMKRVNEFSSAFPEKLG